MYVRGGSKVTERSEPHCHRLILIIEIYLHGEEMKLNTISTQKNSRSLEWNHQPRSGESKRTYFDLEVIHESVLKNCSPYIFCGYEQTRMTFLLLIILLWGWFSRTHTPPHTHVQAAVGSVVPDVQSVPGAPGSVRPSSRLH